MIDRILLIAWITALLCWALSLPISIILLLNGVISGDRMDSAVGAVLFTTWISVAIAGIFNLDRNARNRANYPKDL